MIVDHIKHHTLYTHISERIATALSYLAETDFTALADGRYELEGDQLFALVQRYATRPQEQCVWEAHQRYIDVQYLFSASETIGYAPQMAMKLKEPYSVEKDAAFYSGQGSLVTMTQGMFMVLWPQDVHMPGRMIEQPEKVGKVVVKVAVDVEDA